MTADHMLECMLKQHDEKIKQEARIHLQAAEEQAQHQARAENTTAHLMMALREEANTARRAVLRAEQVEDSLNTEQEAAKYYADASVHVLEAAQSEASIAW